MDINWFEAVMMICFGASWPMAIRKTIVSKNPAGKSRTFMLLVIIGYLAGCLNKLIVHYDNSFWLYLINTLMVATDLVLTCYYLAKNRKKTLQDTAAAS